MLAELVEKLSAASSIRAAASFMRFAAPISLSIWIELLLALMMVMMSWHPANKAMARVGGKFKMAVRSRVFEFLPFAIYEALMYIFGLFALPEWSRRSKHSLWGWEVAAGSVDCLGRKSLVLPSVFLCRPVGVLFRVN